MHKRGGTATSTSTAIGQFFDITYPFKNTSEEMNRLLEDGNRIADETLQVVIDKLTK